MKNQRGAARPSGKTLSKFSERDGGAGGSLCRSLTIDVGVNRFQPVTIGGLQFGKRGWHGDQTKGGQSLLGSGIRSGSGIAGGSARVLRPLILIVKGRVEEGQIRFKPADRGDQFIMLVQPGGQLFLQAFEIQKACCFAAAMFLPPP